MLSDDIEALQGAADRGSLIELRTRLLRPLSPSSSPSVCFYFADEIFNLLIVPYEEASGPLREIKLIYTAPQEYFFTQMKLALFGALVHRLPGDRQPDIQVRAPGLYRHERGAFLPFLIATPVLFGLGAMLVYFLVMPWRWASSSQWSRRAGRGRLN
jgi:sec-independent protein translocase protein TatC